MSGQTVRIRRILPASCEAVFDAWIDAQGMGEWMRPGPVTSCDVKLDARVGGQFSVVMSGPGMQVVNRGEFRVLDRPAKLQFTWISSRWGYQETLITVELHAREESCELVLTHERFPDEHSPDQVFKGWGEILDRLGRQMQVAALNRTVR